MKNILFPTEFADHAGEVFKYAADFAYFFKARLIIMHSIPKPEIRLHVNVDLEKKANIVTDKMLEFVEKNMPEDYKESVKVDYLTKVGFPTDTILDVASSEDVDLIVMGMHTNMNVSKMLFGSTSLGVLVNSDCPVLVVPSQAKFAGITSIVYTTNFEFRDLGAINTLRKWAKAFDADVHCFHVAEGKDDKYTGAKNMEILQKTYAGKGRLHFAAAEGDLRKEIGRFTQNVNADILAMMTHKRNVIARMLKNNVVTDMATKVKVPLLVIKDNAYEWDETLENWVRIVNVYA